MNKRSRLHLPRSPARPGERPDFGYVHLSPAGAVARPDVNARARDIESLAVELVRVLDDAQRGRGSLEPASRSRRIAGRIAPHVVDAPVRRSHATHATRRQDLLLHALARRGGCLGRAVHGTATWRHAVSLLSQSGPVHCARSCTRRYDVPAPLEHARHVQGAAAAGDVPLQGRQYLFDFRKSGNSVSTGGGLGHGSGDQG